MKYIKNDSNNNNSSFTGMKTFNPLIIQKTKKYNKLLLFYYIVILSRTEIILSFLLIFPILFQKT